MAGRGPAPKPPDKRHGHRSATENSLTMLDGRRSEPPAMPEWLHDVCPEVHEWYAAWCDSPQAAEFTGTDWNRLHMVALLVDEFHREPKKRKALLGEIRLNESLLGATATDRLRLHWKVEQPERPSKLTDLIESRRQRLRITDDAS